MIVAFEFTQEHVPVAEVTRESYLQIVFESTVEFGRQEATHVKTPVIV